MTMHDGNDADERLVKVMLNFETIKVLKAADLTHAVGANGGVGPAASRPCPISNIC